MGKRNIYGTTTSSASDGGCKCKPTIDPLVHISSISTLVNTLIQLVHNFFNPVEVTYSLTGEFEVIANISMALGSRLYWVKQHPGIMFNIQDPIHRLQIKAIYLMMNREAEWAKDPLNKVGLNLS